MPGRTKARRPSRLVSKSTTRTMAATSTGGALRKASAALAKATTAINQAQTYLQQQSGGGVLRGGGNAT